jgi:hypothetical protein
MSQQETPTYNGIDMNRKGDTHLEEEEEEEESLSLSLSLDDDEDDDEDEEDVLDLVMGNSNDFGCCRMQQNSFQATVRR